MTNVEEARDRPAGFKAGARLLEPRLQEPFRE
jgi:hypothetical protein